MAGEYDRPAPINAVTLYCAKCSAAQLQQRFKDQSLPPVSVIAGTDVLEVPPSSLEALSNALGVAEPVAWEIEHVPVMECPEKVMEMSKKLV